MKFMMIDETRCKTLPMQSWVHVKDGLPEKGRYLCWGYKFRDADRIWYGILDCYFYPPKGWRMSMNEENEKMDAYIISWMPFPFERYDISLNQTK